MDGIILATPQQLEGYIEAGVKKAMADILPIIHSIAAPAPPPQKEFITRKEAAQTLSISLNTLDAYIRDGKIVAHRIGNRVLLKAADIENAVKTIKTAA